MNISVKFECFTPLMASEEMFFTSALTMVRGVYCVHSVNFCPKTLFWDAKSEEWLYLGI